MKQNRPKNVFMFIDVSVYFEGTFNNSNDLRSEFKLSPPNGRIITAIIVIVKITF